MSKRKDIKLIHELTGLSYGEARKLYKDSGEDLSKALGYDNLAPILDSVFSIIPDLMEAIAKAVESLTEGIASIDWNKAIEDFLNNLEEDKEEC